MNDWLNNEVNRIRREDLATENQNVRQQQIGLYADRLWRDLRSFIEQDVQRMNTTSEIRRRVGEVRFNGTNTQIILVDKLVLPAVHLIISREYTGISVKREIIRSDDGSIESAKQYRETERLDCDLDDSGNVCYRTKDGDWLSAEDISGYILRPILHIT